MRTKKPAPIQTSLPEASSRARVDTASDDRLQYSHIVLSDAEIKSVLHHNAGKSDTQIQEALRQARITKSGQIAAAQYWRQVLSPPAPPSLTFHQFKTFIIQKLLQKIPHYHFDRFNTSIFDQLCQYFFSDPTGNLNLHKGILLVGPVGCGKTSLMRSFIENPFQSFKIFSCRKITYEFAEHGFQVINHYSNLLTSSQNYFLHSTYGILFDDLGTESERRHFGDTTNVMAEIILNRYDHCPFHQTHLTTNLDKDTIILQYGERIFSRFKEMFNILPYDINSPDKRHPPGH